MQNTYSRTKAMFVVVRIMGEETLIIHNRDLLTSDGRCAHDMREGFNLSDLITIGVCEVLYRSKSKNKALNHLKMLEMLEGA